MDLAQWAAANALGKPESEWLMNGRDVGITGFNGSEETAARVYLYLIQSKWRLCMIHPGFAALEKWDTIEYAAGYRARLAAIPDSEIAHHCWRCGWEDADTEALELDRDKRVLATGGEDD